MSEKRSGDSLDEDFFYESDELDESDANEGEAPDTSKNTPLKSPVAEKVTKKQSTKKPRSEYILENDHRLEFSSSDTFVEYLWEKFMNSKRDLTALEQADLATKFKLSPDNIVTIDSKKGDTKEDLKEVASKEDALNENWPLYLESVLNVKQMAKKTKDHGHPRILIITSSAMRAQNIIKNMRTLRLNSAKLYAKHMKVDDQLKSLQSQVCHYAIGTPNRILKLIVLQPEIVSHLEVLIVDGWRDLKKRSVLDIPECLSDFYPLLHCEELHDRLKSMKIKVGIY